MIITGRSKKFEEGIQGFRENLHLVAKLLGDKADLNETSVITILLQKVYEERKLFQSGKEPRQCEIKVKPNEIGFYSGGVNFGWIITVEGEYEFYLMRS
ncbi:hypothetical protein [Ammoniphilus sp. CFH 90114]|uniref:hypothetical protein n=1 Tax=Ammoniphilus sp. CFH 90114 TaxID=2493665 RepID=UPI00100D9E31|nr:hypothetical protein [Ammoniphilus sp. CFH 90114]RXT04565.1 hypothetical protein EIZ39_20335 [Ammoniphilus sp. CFH 90114]